MSTSEPISNNPIPSGTNIREPCLDQGPSFASKVVAAYSIRKNFHALMVRPNGHYAILDGVRGLMMIIVLMFHVFTVYAFAHPDLTIKTVYDELGAGWAWLFHAEYAVDLFFTLSGFLITCVLLRQIDRKGVIDKRNFYFRRFLRLTPVYYFSLLIYFVGGGPNTENIWTNMLYINNFITYENQAMTWAWSLAVEEQFYLIYPLFLGALLKLSKRPLVWMWALFIISFLIRLGIILSDDILRVTPASHLLTDTDYHAHRTSVIYDDFHNRFGVILIGCIAAYYHHYYPKQLGHFISSNAGKTLGWFGLFLILFFFGFPIMDEKYDNHQIIQIIFETVRYNCVGLGLAILIIVSTEKSLLSSILHMTLGHRYWYPLGQLCYAMYLFHLIVIAVVAPTTAKIVSNHPEQYGMYSIDQVGWFIALISFTITALIATFTHLFIERPVMNMR